MSAKEMFEALNYKYEIVDNKLHNCEDVILCTYEDFIIQFNLLSKMMCLQIKNKFEGYSKVAMFMTPALLKAINQQCKELGWLDE